MVVFGFASIGLWLATTGMAPLQSMQVKQVMSKQGKWKLTIPASWTLVETTSGANGDPSVIAIITEPSPNNIGVYGEIREFDQPISDLSNVSERGVQISKLKNGYTQLSLEPTQISEELTIVHIYTYEIPSFPQGTSNIQCIDNYRYHSNAGYSLTLCTPQERYSALEPTFLQGIKSFVE